MKPTKPDNTHLHESKRYSHGDCTITFLRQDTETGPDFKEGQKSDECLYSKTFIISF